MVARKKAPAKPENSNRTCGNCGWGTPDMKPSNMDLQGKPICVSCPHHEWMRIRSSKACDKWKPKIAENGKSAK